MLLLVIEFSEFALDGQALLAFLNMSHNLGIYVEAFRDGDNLVGLLRTDVYFHAVAHVEHLIHLAPVGS